MTRAELDALAELASKATPGPYRVVHEEPEFMLPYDAVVAADGNRSRCCIYTDDANYIAACSPDRILDLLSRLSRAEARCARLEVALRVFIERAEWCAKSGRSYHRDAAQIFCERVDQARAALAETEDK